MSKFLILYVIFVILIGSTGVIEEMALGRATKGGPIKAFGDCVQMRTGKRRFAEESVNNGADKPVGKWFVILGKYVLVPLSFIALVAGAILGGIG